MKNERLDDELIGETIRVASDYSTRLDDRELEGIYRVSKEIVRVNGFRNPTVANLESFRLDAFGRELTKRKVETKMKDALAFCKSINDAELKSAYRNYKSYNAGVEVKSGGLIESYMEPEYFLAKAVEKIAYERGVGGLIAQHIN